MTFAAVAGPRIAVYAGTFDPPTRGHLSVLERAAALFDQVLVLVAVNPSKQPLFTPGERVDLLALTTRHLPNVRCDHSEALVVEFARAHQARFLVRGVRGATDADYEAALAHANRALAPEIVTVFLPADAELSAVSSSLLKRMAALGEDIAPHCCPEVADRLRRRLRERPPMKKGDAPCSR
jgi:pantetheine-phosphate adenylyltransferase